ncbi:TPA: hypothetical protein ACGOVP_001113 [Streptococcus suis]
MKRTRSHQPYRSDFECETRTNLPTNHCAEMLTRILRSEAGLSVHPQPVTLKQESNRVLSSAQ